jgi:hypothetical protein
VGQYYKETVRVLSLSFLNTDILALASLPVCHRGGVNLVGHMACRWAYLKDCSVVGPGTRKAVSSTQNVRGSDVRTRATSTGPIWGFSSASLSYTSVGMPINDNYEELEYYILHQISGRSSITDHSSTAAVHCHTLRA